MLRLIDNSSGQGCLVDAGRVYRDLDGDGRISREDACEEPRMLEAARYFRSRADPRMPGQLSPDGSVRSAGRLNAAELAQFQAPPGTRALRPLLEEHLAFFDRRECGRISLGDSYLSWRALGFGPLKSLFQTLGAGLIFGWRHGGTIVIDQIHRSRPARPTGIYDPEGNLDEAAWAALAAELESVSSCARVRNLMRSRGLGPIPARQFESLFAVCERLNGQDTISLQQIRWLYDGSLLWRAAESLRATSPQPGRRGEPAPPGSGPSRPP